MFLLSIAVGPLLAASVALAACSTGSPTTFPEVKNSHRITFNDSLNGSPFTVAAYISPNFFADADFAPTQGHVWIHGEQRNADEMVTAFKTATAAAVQNGALANVNDTVLLAPIFAHDNDAAAAMFPGVLTWDCNDWMGGGDAEALPVSSFDVLQSALAFLARTYPSIDTLVLAGHSAGGQITQRWALANPDAGLAARRAPPVIDCSTPPPDGFAVAGQRRATAVSPARYVVANPSSFAYFTPQRADCTSNSTCICTAPGYPQCCTKFNDWKYGLQNYTQRYAAASLAYPDAPALTARYAARTVRYLFGTADDLGQMNGCESNAQGVGHFDRGLKWWTYLQQLVPFIQLTQRADNVTGVGHNATLMFSSDVGTKALFVY